MPALSVKELRDSAVEIAAMFNDYTKAPTLELTADLLVYGFLRGRFVKVKRQHSVGKAKGKGKKRRQIDYRFGTTNPTVLEFAFRPRGGTVQLYGSQNTPELQKLTKVRSASVRALLLVDLHSGGPIDEDRLRATYDKLNAGRGRFERRSVRVVYAHANGTVYDFPWKPSKAK